MYILSGAATAAVANGHPAAAGEQRAWTGQSPGLWPAGARAPEVLACRRWGSAAPSPTRGGAALAPLPPCRRPLCLRSLSPRPLSVVVAVSAGAVGFSGLRSGDQCAFVALRWGGGAVGPNACGGEEKCGVES